MEHAPTPKKRLLSTTQMRIVIVILSVLALVAALSCRYDAAPAIVAHSDTFKLVSFQDLHLGERHMNLTFDPRGPEKDANTTKLMNSILDAENVDFVAYNGDMTSGEYLFSENATNYIDIAVAPVVKRGIPFASTYGNHDESVNMTHQKYFSYETQTYALSHTQSNPDSSDDPRGQFNFVVPVLRHGKLALLLWFFDSRSSQYPSDGKTYKKLDDWIDEKAAPWLNNTAKSLEAKYGALAPSIVFTHIPGYEAVRVQEKFHGSHVKGLDEDHYPLWYQGSYHTGLHEPERKWWDSVKYTLGANHNVLLVHGHDHGENWIYPSVEAPHISIGLGRRVGWGGYGDWTRGAQLFEVDFEKNVLNAHVRLEDGNEHYASSFSFGKFK